MAKSFGFVDDVIVLPAAINVRLLIVIGAIKLVLQPINALSSIIVLFLVFPL